MSASDCYVFLLGFLGQSVDLIHTVKQSSKTLHNNASKTRVLTSIKLHGQSIFEPQNRFLKPRIQKSWMV